MAMFNEKTKALLFNAARAKGRDVEGILSYIEEELTGIECKQVEAFLTWSFENDKPFGRGNFEERVLEFKKSTKQRDRVRIVKEA